MYPVSSRWPSLNALKAFWHVARHLSMQQAAEDLHVSPTAVSHQIKGLETDLHTRLFERRTRSLKLTPAGEELYRVVSGAFCEIDAGIEAIRASSIKRGITVAASAVFGSKWLLPRLKAFETSHPGIEVRVITIPYVNLNEFSCDVGFRYGTDVAAMYPSYDAEPLFEVVLEPVCSPRLLDPARPTNSALLRDAPLLHDEDSGKPTWVPGWETFFKKVLKTSELPIGGLRFSSAYMVSEAAIAGHGWALAISKLADVDVEAGRLVRPLRLSLATGGHYWMFMNKSSQYDPNVKIFARWVRETVDATLKGPEVREKVVQVAADKRKAATATASRRR
jgi:LysR family glycine cleavage system transcriptional activator